MIDKKAFVDAFGSLSNAAVMIGCSRRAIYNWLEDGNIPDSCDRGLAAGQDWHSIITELGFDPSTLKPL